MASSADAGPPERFADKARLICNDSATALNRARCRALISSIANTGRGHSARANARRGI